MIAILQSISETKPFGIQQIFLVTTIDPGFNNPTQAHTKFLATLNQKKAEINATHISIKILTFKVVFSSPTTYLLTHNMCISTKHTRLRSSNPNRHRWCKFWRVFPAIANLSVFVPNTMRYKYPEGFEKAIKYQTWQITNNSTLVLQNIPESRRCTI